MSTPEAAGPARPARLAGLILLALAGIALVIGLVSVIGGDEPDQGASPPPSSQPPATEQSSTATPPPPPPSTSSTPAPPPASSTTSAGATPPPSAPPSQPPVGGPDKTQPVRVYNNSTISGLAEQAAGDFRGNGWNVPVVSNYPGGKIAVTTVYFRPGTGEEASARELAKEFGLRVEPRFDGIQDADPGVIVIVTREYKPKAK